MPQLYRTAPQITTPNCVIVAMPAETANLVLASNHFARQRIMADCECISAEWIKANATKGIAFSNAQLKALGVEAPPTKGWMQRLIGTPLTTERLEAFRVASMPTLKTIRQESKALLQQRKKERRARRRLRRLQEQADGSKPRAIGTSSKRCQSGPPAPRYQGDVNAPEFLHSYAWRTLRMRVLVHWGAKCMCCGATPQDGAVMNVDHIKPRRLFPKLALDFDNLQVLCHECNHGKSNWDKSDWRPIPAPEWEAQEVQRQKEHLASIMAV